MNNIDSIKKTIEMSRKTSQNGELVTYDLTNGVDFSNPKLVDEALSEVFFEKDVSNWFTISEDDIEFKPSYKVQIVLAENHHNLMCKISEGFLKDVKNDDIGKRYAPTINKESGNDSAFVRSIAGRSLLSSFYKHGEDKILKNYLGDDLFTDILECLVIKSLNNEDLINWNKLNL